MSSISPHDEYPPGFNPDDLPPSSALDSVASSLPPHEIANSEVPFRSQSIRTSPPDLSEFPLLWPEHQPPIGSQFSEDIQKVEAALSESTAAFDRWANEINLEFSRLETKCVAIDASFRCYVESIKCLEEVSGETTLEEIIARRNLAEVEEFIAERDPEVVFEKEGIRERSLVRLLELISQFGDDERGLKSTKGWIMAVLERVKGEDGGMREELKRVLKVIVREFEREDSQESRLIFHMTRGLIFSLDD
jgi:hypothetical protein